MGERKRRKNFGVVTEGGGRKELAETSKTSLPDEDCRSCAQGDILALETITKRVSRGKKKRVMCRVSAWEGLTRTEAYRSSEARRERKEVRIPSRSSIEGENSGNP